MEFTTRSREALAAAQQAAVSGGNPQLDATHLLSALLVEPDGIPATLLQAIGENGLQFDSGIEVISCALTAAGLYFSFTGDAQGWFNA